MEEGNSNTSTLSTTENLEMKSFKQFLDEQGWIRSRGTEEHDEIHHQLQVHADGHMHLPDHLHKAMTHLSNPENYRKALAGSKRETYNPHKVRSNNVNNTDAGEKNRAKAIGGLDKNKVGRVGKNKAVERSPVILRHKASGHEHLLGGNTRMTMHKNVKAHVIEY